MTIRRREPITIHEGHASVNVKIHRRLDSADCYTDSDRERAWDMTVEQFWNDATRAAHKRGYSGVFAEGRSGGWCAPYLWTKPGVKHSYNGAYSQGPEVGYPVFPDVASDGGAREKFRAFEREIRDQAIYALKELYEKQGFSKRAISAAFKTVERKED